MEEQKITGTRQMVLAQDMEGNVFKVFADAIPPAAMVEHDEKELVLIQDPSTNRVYKAFGDEVARLAGLDPGLLVAMNWKDLWKDYKGARPPMPRWRDQAWLDSESVAVVEQVAELPSLESYLEEQPDLKFVPIKEFE